MRRLTRRAVLAAGLAAGAAGAMPLRRRRRERPMARLVDWTSRVQETIAAGPYAAEWESLTGVGVPDWYRAGKFGIFIHWGPYCVPAFGNEWYPRNMYQRDQAAYRHHVENWGPSAEFGYKDFIPRLTARDYDPAAWAALFREAGAKFVVPVAEHHDGFAMYETELSDWCAAKMGPRRDLLGELAEAVRAEHLVFGCSSHRAEHWWYFDGGMSFPSDVQDPRYAGLYGPARPRDTQPDAAFLDDWLARCCELVDRYRPQLFWFDWWIEQPAFAPYLQKFAAYYYNRGVEWGEGVAINYKNKAFAESSAVYDIERGQLQDVSPLFWQNDTSVSKNSWGYITHHDYKTATSIVGDLVDIVAKNGALLLNIGPRADGTIPEHEQSMLRDIGAWLAANGAAIYGTRPFAVFGEGPTEVPEGGFTDTRRGAFCGEDVRFTVGGDTLYATFMAWPGEHGLIRSLPAGGALLPAPVTEAVLLATGRRVPYRQDADGLHLTLPADPPGLHAWPVALRCG